jgi:hypothetical protein
MQQPLKVHFMQCQGGTNNCSTKLKTVDNVSMESQGIHESHSAIQADSHACSHQYSSLTPYSAGGVAPHLAHCRVDQPCNNFILYDNVFTATNVQLCPTPVLPAVNGAAVSRRVGHTAAASRHKAQPRGGTYFSQGGSRHLVKM